MSNKNILVISPNPDDLEIGMGGTVAKLVDQGVSVVSLVTTEGSGSPTLSGFEGNELALLREEEARIASEILGLNRYRAVFDERHGVPKMQYAEVFIELKL